LSSRTNHLLQIPDAWLPSVHLASFGMIMGGLVQVVLQLNARGSDIAEFERACEELAIAHLGIILTLVPATAWMSAVHLFGKEWVLYAAFLVVINDTAAYIFGKNFGKNALLPTISPNKTWEGWMGALVSTLILSFPLWKALFQNTARYDQHAFVLALYCAVVAPFGGFLASTVKRAYGKKDFGSLIAGHGGLIDRLDCQLVTAPFVYLYLTAVKVQGSPLSLSL
jgi:phosphatidate cytidylyltransferase